MDSLHLQSLLSLRGSFITLLFFIAFFSINFLKINNISFIKKLSNKLVLFTFTVGICSSFIYLVYPVLKELAEVSIISNFFKYLFNENYLMYSNESSIFLEASPYSPAIFYIVSLFNFYDINNPILLSKIPSFLSFIISIYILVKIIKNNFSTKYLVLILIYGNTLFLVRPDSFLLLISSLSLYIFDLYLEKKITRKIFIFWLSFFGGIAAAFKIYGIIFIASLALFILPVRIAEILIATVISIITFCFFFLPDQASINDFFQQLSFFSTSFHFSLKIFINNFIFLIFIFLPFFYLILKNKLFINQNILIKLSLLFILELSIAIIGSKVGSSDYFLIPFIPINAYLFQYLSNTFNNDNENLLNNVQVNSGLIAISLFCIFSQIFWSYKLIKDFPNSNAIIKDLNEISSNYDKFIFGVTDQKSYQFIFYLPYLEMKNNQQLDYASYFEFDNAGLNVNFELNKAFMNCNIKYFIMYNQGSPFTIRNGYTFSYLFDSYLRENFKAQYKLVDKSKFFNIYQCKY